MKNLILTSIFAISQIASATNFALIEHSEFVKLDQEKQIYYVKAVRDAVVKIVNGKKESAFLKNEMLFLKMNLNEAVASSDECVAAGHKIKRDPVTGKCGKSSEAIMNCEPARVGAKNKYACPPDTFGYDFSGNVKCAPNRNQCSDSVKYEPSQERCVFAGKVLDIDFANETCGSKPGVKSTVDIDMVCDPVRVGVERKYPCLPLQLYGYDKDGKVLCVADSPRNRQYGFSCLDELRKYPVTTAHAAMVMTMNAENYNRLDQTIRKRCRNINGGNCRVALLDLQDAALYVKSSVPSNNLATENRVTQ